MNITEEELQRIVALDVRKALEEIKNVQEHESCAAESPIQYGEGSVQHFSDEELEEAMRLMASNRGKDGEPMVGIFWYDSNKNDLFGVRSHMVSDYVKPYARSEFGCVSCSEMHEDVWKKEYHKQKYKTEG